MSIKDVAASQLPELTVESTQPHAGLPDFTLPCIRLIKYNDGFMIFLLLSEGEKN